MVLTENNNSQFQQKFKGGKVQDSMKITFLELENETPRTMQK